MEGTEGHGCIREIGTEYVVQTEAESNSKTDEEEREYHDREGRRADEHDVCDDHEALC